MRMVTRHRTADADGFLASARRALDLLAAQPGFLDGEIGRSPDDGSRWLMTTRWLDAGSMRRGMSGPVVRAALVPLQATATDEAAVFEVLVAATSDGLRERVSYRSSDEPRRPLP